LWVIRLLVTAVQIGGEHREKALDQLFSRKGRGRAYADAHFAGHLLVAQRAEHFVRAFDATSRHLLRVCGEKTDVRLLVATVVFLRTVSVEGGNARALLDAVAARKRLVFSSGEAAKYAPSRCPRAYTPLGKDAGVYKSDRVATVVKRLSEFFASRDPIDWSPSGMQHLIAYRGDADMHCQFGLMQVAMDLRLLLPAAHKQHFARWLPLYEVVGPGCKLRSAEELRAVADFLSRHRVLGRPFAPLGVRPSGLGWFFLAEHADCAVRKYLADAGPAAYSTCCRAPSREQFVERYRDAGKEKSYLAALKTLQRLTAAQ